MTDPWILFAFVAAALAVIAGMLPDRSRRGALLSSPLLLIAALAVLGSAADPRPWGAEAVMAAIARDSHAVDPRVWSAFALSIAALVGLPGLARALGTARPNPIAALTPGAIMAMLVSASAAFLGLRATPVLAGAALGAFAFGVALALALRGFAAGGATPWRALAATGAALVAVAVTLAVYGARSEPLDIDQGATAEAMGMSLAYHGDTALDAARHRLSVTLRDARGSRELAPELWGDPAGATHGVGAGDWLGSPVVVPIGLREVHAPGHDVTWIKKGESTTLPGGSMRFDGFRIEGRDTVRMYADLTVTRGTVTDHVAPWIIAGPKGHQPFSVDIPGFGPVAIAAIDADNKRVGLMMPHGAAPPKTSTAAFLIRTRPTLAGAWLGAALTLVAAIMSALTAASRREGARG